jgi:hypothetical protein
MRFPSPTDPQPNRSAVLLGYLDYFRSVVLDKLDGLSETDLRSSRLPSGWTPSSTPATPDIWTSSVS